MRSNMVLDVITFLVVLAAGTCLFVAFTRGGNSWMVASIVFSFLGTWMGWQSIKAHAGYSG